MERFQSVSESEMSWALELRMGGFTCPRDLFFVAGKQVVEASIQRGIVVMSPMAFCERPGADELAEPLFRAPGVEGPAHESAAQVERLRLASSETEAQRRLWKFADDIGLR